MIKFYEIFLLVMNLVVLEEEILKSNNMTNIEKEEHILICK